MNDAQALAIPVLALFAIVGGALVGWALGRRTAFRWLLTMSKPEFRAIANLRDNPDPSDSAGA